MPQPTALVLYASKHGQAAKIASRIAAVLRERGVDVTLRRAAGGTDESPAGFDGWIPDTTLPVAGALQYREYDFVTRLVMRLITSQHESFADATHDHEFTDWEALDRFASAFASTLTHHLSTT